MARPLRLEFAGALYHITSRGDRQGDIYDFEIDKDRELSEVPMSQRRAMPKELSVYERQAKTRNQAIVNAYASGGYSLREVGDYFGMHYSTVSGIVKNHKSKT